MKSFQLPPRMQDRTKREKTRPDIVEEEGKIDGPRGVGNRESGSIVPADDGPFFVVVEQPKKKRNIKMGGETFFYYWKFHRERTTFFLKRKWEPMMMDEVNRIGTALRVGWKEEINNNNQMTNEVRIFLGCVCVCAVLGGDPR